MPTQAVKRGAEAHAIGRSRGGLTPKIPAAVDALGMLIRFTITPGQWGDCPQTRGLIEGLKGVGHVMAGAAYDADDLRQFIADDLGAEAQIKQNPTRKTTKSIDWVLYKDGIWWSVSSIGSGGSEGPHFDAKSLNRPSNHS